MSRFIAVCGMPGSGRTTLAKALRAHFKLGGEACSILQTRRSSASLLRRLSALAPPDHSSWEPREHIAAEVLLTELLRVTREVIEPALEDHRNIVADRWYLDHLVSQAYFGVHVEQDYAPLISSLPQPTLTVILTIPCDVALARNTAQGFAAPFATSREYLDFAATAYATEGARVSPHLFLDGSLATETLVASTVQALAALA
jgi:thymidylate kinase